MKGKTKMEVPTYLRSLNYQDLIYQISEIGKYFDMEQIKDPKRVKIACLKLKGHTLLWWDNVQDDEVRKEKHKIKSWDIMIYKLRDKFLPTDYMITLFKKLQNLRQKEIPIQ